MSLSQVFLRIQHHMKYNDFYKCIFVTWDNGKERFVFRQDKQRKIVIFSIFVQFCQVIAQISATVTKSTSLIDTAEAIGITTIYLLSLILRWNFDDYVQVQLLNLINNSKSKLHFKPIFYIKLYRYFHFY